MGKSIEKHDRLYRTGLPMAPDIAFIEESTSPVRSSMRELQSFYCMYVSGSGSLVMAKEDSLLPLLIGYRLRPVLEAWALN